MPTFEDIIKVLGLEEQEAATYTALLESGPITAGNLARILSMPRPSLYGFLERLQAAGLVTQTLNFEGVKVFAPEAPEKVNLLFDQKIATLQDKQSAYQELLEELRTQGTHSVSTPKFQLFEGEVGLKHILKDMLLYRNIDTYSFWPIQTMLETLGSDFFNYLNKQRIKNKLFTYAIWPASQIADTKEHPYLGSGEGFLREIRIAPKNVDFTMGYWIYANRCAFISSRKEGVGFIIESAEMAQMLLAQHQVLWNISKPLKTTSEAGETFLQGI